MGVRGYNTQKLLRQFGVDAQVIGDLAFSVEMPNVTVEPRLAVGGVRRDSSGAQSYFRQVYSFLRKQGWTVKLVMMSGNDVRQFSEFPVSPYTSLEETLRAVSRASLVVGQRLHMTLYGLVAGRKAVGFEYAWEKMKDSLSALNYPYYLSNPDFPRFKKLYFQLVDDSQIMPRTQEKISWYRDAQREFARQILMEFNRLSK